MTRLVSISQEDFKKYGCPKCNSKNAHDFVVQDHNKLCVCYDCESTFGVSTSNFKGAFAPLQRTDGIIVQITPSKHPEANVNR